MKLGDIFTYGKPMFADKLANVSFIGSMRRANRLLVIFAVTCLVLAFARFNQTYEIIPRPVYREDVPEAIRSQLPPEVYNLIPSRAGKPWYDILNIRL